MPEYTEDKCLCGFPTAICPYFKPWTVQLATSQGLAGQVVAFRSIEM